jgi:hypothetical protein
MRADVDLDIGRKIFASGLLPQLISVLRRCRPGDLRFTSPCASACALFNCARLIFLRAAADKVRSFRVALLPVRLPRAANAAPKRFTSPCASACAFLNCWTTPDRFAMKFPLAWDCIRTNGGTFHRYFSDSVTVLCERECQTSVPRN